MKTISPWQAVYLSFFSKDLYRSVVRDWKGIAFLYLMVLVVVSWLLISLKVYLVVDQAISGPVAAVVSELPSVSIKDGEMSISKKSPYEVKVHPSDGGAPFPVVVFDSSTDSVKGRENVPFIVTKHSFFVGGNTDSVQQYELKQLGDMDLDQAGYHS